MTIKTSLLAISSLLLLVILLLLPPLITAMEEEEKKARLEVFSIGSGWGYQIVKGEKRLIYQPTIPAVDTVMAFPDKMSALEVGTLVLIRFKAKHDFSVSKDEVIQRISVNVD